MDINDILAIRTLLGPALKKEHTVSTEDKKDASVLDKMVEEQKENNSEEEVAKDNISAGLGDKEPENKTEIVACEKCNGNTATFRPDLKKNLCDDCYSTLVTEVKANKYASDIQNLIKGMKFGQYDN